MKHIIKHAGYVASKIKTLSVRNASITHVKSDREVMFNISPYKLHRLDDNDLKLATSTTLNSEDALRIYTKLVFARQLKPYFAKLFKTSTIKDHNFYMGQEAVAVGMQTQMRPIDSVLAAYRWDGTIIGVLGELSKQESSRDDRIPSQRPGLTYFGGNGIVGAHVSLSAGLALAHKYYGDGGVSFALYGYGSANEGQLYEVFNMAQIWKLPCVFVCEHYPCSIGTTAQSLTANAEYYKRGDTIPGIWVDGTDVLATREATRFAIDYCSSGRGPLIIEMDTSLTDERNVRDTLDPLIIFRYMILNAGLATLDQLEAIRKRSLDVFEVTNEFLRECE